MTSTVPTTEEPTKEKETVAKEETAEVAGVSRPIPFVN